MDNLEPSGLVTPHPRCMSLIPRLTLPFSILESYIRGLEDSDWERMRAVLANGLQESRD